MSDTTIIIARVEVETVEAETRRAAIETVLNKAMDCEARIADSYLDETIRGLWALEDRRAAGLPDSDLYSSTP